MNQNVSVELFVAHKLEVHVTQVSFQWTAKVFVFPLSDTENRFSADAFR